MSKSVKRVRQALEAAGIRAEIMEMDSATRTAREAAETVGCEEDQIAKSIIFRATRSDRVALFVTAGGRQVDPDRATALVGEDLGRADAAFVRARTGFVIGGVAPVGHLEDPVAFFDRRLLDFATVWAAAGTPRHVFPAIPSDLLRAASSQLADFTSLSG